MMYPMMNSSVTRISDEIHQFFFHIWLRWEDTFKVNLSLPAFDWWSHAMMKNCECVGFIQYHNFPSTTNSREFYDIFSSSCVNFKLRFFRVSCRYSNISHKTIFHSLIYPPIRWLDSHNSQRKQRKKDMCFSTVSNFSESIAWRRENINISTLVDSIGMI